MLIGLCDRPIEYGSYCKRNDAGYESPCSNHEASFRCCNRCTRDKWSPNHPQTWPCATGQASRNGATEANPFPSGTVMEPSHLPKSSSRGQSPRRLPRDIARRRFPKGTFLVGYEAVVFLSPCESDDGPRRPSTGPAHALDPMVPVLKDELSVAVSHDYGRRLPPFLSQFVHVPDPIIPVVALDWAQHRVALEGGRPVDAVDRGAASAWGQPTTPVPRAVAWQARHCPLHWTRQKGTDPPSRLSARVRRPLGHSRPRTLVRRASPLRYPCSLNRATQNGGDSLLGGLADDAAR